MAPSSSGNDDEKENSNHGASASIDDDGRLLPGAGDAPAGGAGDGVMHVADAPSPRHQSAVADLFRALDRHVSEGDLGRMWLAPLDVVLDAEQSLIVQPDLLFVSSAREVIVQDRVRGAPDLVIEVLSPDPRIGRTVEHIAWFAAYDVRECWWVETIRREVTVMTFDDRRVSGRRTYAATDPIRSRVLPDWSMTLNEVLRP
jgi:Uma2 family endonuclease